MSALETYPSLIESSTTSTLTLGGISGVCAENTVRLQVSDGNGTLVAHVASTAQSQMETNPTNHVDNHTKTILNKDENCQLKNHNLRKYPASYAAQSHVQGKWNHVDKSIAMLS
jgi:hypothetical protein